MEESHSQPTFAFEDMVAAVSEYAVFTLDAGGHVQNWNRGAELAKQYAADEIIGKHFSIFYSQEDRDRGIPEWEMQVVREKGSFTDEGWRFRKDGSQFWASVTITGIFDPETGEISGFLKITRDLTERMLANEGLRQSEERFRLLLESVRDYAIFMLDPEGHVMSWNAGARRLKGYEESEVLGSHFSRFYPEDLRASHVPEALLRKALSEGKAETEGWRIRKDGTRFWGNITITPLFDPTGELRGFAKITRDLSDQRQVAQLQRSATRKDVFLATLGHELRNPLAPLLPGLEVLRNSGNNPDLLAKISGVFERQIGQMAHLIDDLLDMSRIAAGKIALKRAHTPLSAPIDTAVEAVLPLMEENGHRLEVSLLPEPITIDADPFRLSQVVSNLLTNSARYTPRGGRIELKVTSEPGAILRIDVIDNGRGVAKELQGEIFELFEQGTGQPGQGLGIGLTLVRKLVELHGGTVVLHSEGIGQGSVVTVRLPVIVASPSGHVVADAEEAASAPARISVLVADDAKTTADVMGMFFELEGYAVQIANDGEQAVEKVLASAPDVAFLDLGMPRLDGYEAARRIARIAPKTVLIALSGWGREDDIQRSAEAGFTLHLVKPVKPDELRTIMASLFEKRDDPH